MGRRAGGHQPGPERRPPEQRGAGGRRRRRRGGGGEAVGFITPGQDEGASSGKTEHLFGYEKLH